MALKQLISSFILSLLIFSPAAAQAPDAQISGMAGSAKKSGEDRRAIRKKALALLDEVVAEAQTLRLAENRIRIHAIAANILWTHDEERARALFEVAMSGLSQITSGIAPAGDPQRMGAVTPVFAQLRHELLQLLAQRDASLALEFLRATRRPPHSSQPGADRNLLNQELALEMNLATQIAAEDPQQALRMAEESLSRGFSPELVNLVSRIHERDREAASKLASDIIRKLRPEVLTKDQGALVLAMNLLQKIRRGAGASGPEPSASRPAPARTVEPLESFIDEQAARELIDSAVTALINASADEKAMSGSAHMLFVTLQEMMPEVEQYLPGRVRALRRKIAEFDRMQDPQTRVWREYEGLIRGGTIDALLEAAAKAPPEARDQLYDSAAWKASSQDRIAQARQIINDHITDPQQRARILRDMNLQSFLRAAEQGKLEEAREAFALISPDERLSLLTLLASSAANRGDEKVARELLDEARSQFGDRAEDYAQFSAQLQIARAYAHLDPAQSFKIIEEVVDRFNELSAPAAALNESGRNSFKNGKRRAQGGYAWRELIQNCAEALASLAHADFDRARSVVSRFQGSEVRLMARLWVAQGVLSDPTAVTGGGISNGISRMSTR